MHISKPVCGENMQTKSFKTIFIEDEDIFKEETVTSHNVQLTRNLPNILRNNNAKISRSHKNHLMNKLDISTSSAEDIANTSLELNATFSSLDLDTETNKITSSKSYHQRKQVHNPLDIQYDISDCNNNKNKNTPSKVDQLSTLPSGENNDASTKKKHDDKQKKKSRSLRKSRKVTTRKSDSRTKTSRKKSSASTTVPVINNNNVKNSVAMQNTNNFLKNDDQPTCDPNFSYASDLHDVTTKSIDKSNVFYRNNEVYNFEKKYDVYLNHIIPNKPTELDTAQYKTTPRELTSYEFSEDNLQQESIVRNIDSSFLYRPKILYSCSCADCMSHDKEIIFYEDPVSTSTSSDDMEAELLTCDLYTNIMDFYTNNYFHVFDNLMDVEETDCEEIGEIKITTENICVNTKNTTGLIEDSSNTSIINQNKSENLLCHVDEVQNCIESYTAEAATYPNKAATKIEDVKVLGDTDTSNHLNSEKSTKKNEKIFQDKALIPTISTDTFKSNYQTEKNEKDLCVIQCSRCDKLFNKKHRLWKHFTRCDFYKENFKCQICNKIYRHRSTLAHHLRMAHNISSGLHEEFYTCNKCSKSYVRFRAFQRHMLLHDN